LATAGVKTTLRVQLETCNATGAGASSTVCNETVTGLLRNAYRYLKALYGIPDAKTAFLALPNTYMTNVSYLFANTSIADAFLNRLFNSILIQLWSVD
jgi:hypothetical protein